MSCLMYDPVGATRSSIFTRFRILAGFPRGSAAEFEVPLSAPYAQIIEARNTGKSMEMRFIKLGLLRVHIALMACFDKHQKGRTDSGPAFEKKLKRLRISLRPRNKRSGRECRRRFCPCCLQRRRE